MNRIIRISIICRAGIFSRTYFYIDLCDRAAKFYYERKGSHLSMNSAAFCIRHADNRQMEDAVYP